MNFYKFINVSLSSGGRSWAGVSIDEERLSNLPKCSPGLVPQSPSSNCAGHTPGDVGEAQRLTGFEGPAQKICFFKEGTGKKQEGRLTLGGVRDFAHKMILQGKFVS